jgi:hypothetical protein
MNGLLNTRQKKDKTEEWGIRHDDEHGARKGEGCLLGDDMGGWVALAKCQ